MGMLNQFKKAPLILISALLSVNAIALDTILAPVLKGRRMLGMEINLTTPASDYFKNMDFAKAAGAEYVSLLLPWELIEPNAPTDCSTPATYTDPGNYLAILNSVLPKAGLKLSLTIAIINTNMDARPRSLKGRTVDDPVVQCRYGQMLKFVFSRIPALKLTSFQVANEVDAFPQSYTNPNFWLQFTRFVLVQKRIVKSYRSSVPVSFIATLGGAIGQTGNISAPSGLQLANMFTDLVAVTYYPLGPNFTVQDPPQVARDVDALMARYPSKKVTFNEFGCQTGSQFNRSSEAIQQKFISDFFTVWDRYNSQIVSALFFQLNDTSYDQAKQLAQMFGIGDHDGFVEYLQTLGLRTYDGVDKLGYKQLIREVNRRWWFMPYYPNW